MSKVRIRSYIYLIIVAAIWGAASPIIKFTLSEIDPLPFLAYRFSISAIFAIIFLFINGFHFNKISQQPVKMFSYGLLAFPVALLALFTGLDNSTVLDLNLITIAEPLLLSLGGALIFHDVITKREKIGTTLVLIGALIAAFSPVITKEADLHITGNIFIILYMLSDASAVLISKSMTKNKLKPATITNYGFIIAALVLIPIAFLSYGDNLLQTIIQLPLAYHLGVWYMALMSGTLAYFLWVEGQKSIEISEAGLFYYLIPLFSTPLAVLWLGETITPIFVISAIIIASGILLAEKK